MKFCLIPLLSLILLLFVLQLSAKPYQPNSCEAENCSKNHSQPIPLNDTGLLMAVNAVKNSIIFGWKVNYTLIYSAKKCIDKKTIFYYPDLEWKMTADEPIDFVACSNGIIKKGPGDSNYTAYDFFCWVKQRNNSIELAEGNGKDDPQPIPVNDTGLVAAVDAVKSQLVGPANKIKSTLIFEAKKLTVKPLVYYYVDLSMNMTADSRLKYMYCRNVTIEKGPGDSNYTLDIFACIIQLEKEAVVTEIAETASPASTSAEIHSIPLNDTRLVAAVKAVANSGVFAHDPLKWYNIISAKERVESKNSLSFFYVGLEIFNEPPPTNNVPTHCYITIKAQGTPEKYSMTEAQCGIFKL